MRLRQMSSQAAPQDQIDTIINGASILFGEASDCFLFILVKLPQVL